MDLSLALRNLAANFRIGGAADAQLALAALVLLDGNNEIVVDGRDLAGTAARLLSAGGAAPLASPVFTGNPTAPTQTAGNNSTRLATTAFVAAAISALVNAAPGALDTLKELADALGDDANYAATITAALAAKAPILPSYGDISVIANELPLTGATDVYQNTGLSVALPAAGTYALACNIGCRINTGTGTFWQIDGRLYNVTAAAAVANSQRLILFRAQAGDIGVSAPINIVLTVAGATAVRLEVARRFDGDFTTSFLYGADDVSAMTTLSWVRLS